MRGRKDITPDDIELIEQMRSKGLSITAISWWLEMKASAIRSIIKAYKMVKGEKK
jgi:hypothetical protein